MPKPFSDDLRCRILLRYDEGDISLEELAQEFSVSYGYTKKIRREQLRSGQMQRPVQTRYGPVSKVTAQIEEQLREHLQQQPDLTLLELQQRVQAGSGVALSKTRLWEVLERMGWRRKKNTVRQRTGEHASSAAAANLASGYRGVGPRPASVSR